MYELPVVTLRYSNVYGPHQSPNNPYCGVVSKFFEACDEGQPMKVHGNGLQTRDYTFVDDAVDATFRAGISPRAVGEIVNVGFGFETSVRELAAMIAVVTKTSGDMEFIKSPATSTMFSAASSTSSEHEGYCGGPHKLRLKPASR